MSFLLTSQQSFCLSAPRRRPGQQQHCHLGLNAQKDKRRRCLPTSMLYIKNPKYCYIVGEYLHMFLFLYHYGERCDHLKLRMSQNEVC